MASLERDRVPPARPLASMETQLIDRVEEMKLLKEAADRAISGEGGVVFLCGEAGIGKTRLTRELGAYARLRGMQVLYGRCPALFRMDGVPPYVLWSEVIKDYLHSCTPDQLYNVIGLYPGELLKLVPEIKQKFRVLSESLPISPEHGRDRLFEAVSQFVTNISKEMPLLVILDDLQWTDQTSLLLLHYLARGVYREPLLLLGAYRDTDVDEKHPLTPVLTELNRERLLQSAQLKRISFDDTSEMIKRILAQDDVSREFCELVYEKTRGNPFFAEEVIRSLKEEEVIYCGENKWVIKDVSKIEFPKTVKSVIKARIARLDDECQNVLAFASFIGNDFTPEAVGAVAGIEESKLLDLMDKMFKTGLIEERVFHGEGFCSFADILVRDVVYEEVSPLKRKKLHGVVGNALEQLYAKNIDEHFGELASHFLESGEKDKALKYFLKAGERAAKLYANSEAASYYQSALRLLEEKEKETQEKGLVLERLGDIKSLVGEYDLALKYWNEGLLLLRQRPLEASPLDLARLHRKMAHVLWHNTGDAEKASKHQEEALKILESQVESDESARLYADMARMYWRAGYADKGRLWAEKALEFAKKLNDTEIMATSCLELAAVFGMMGERSKAVEFAETALQIALDNNYLEIASRAYNNLTTNLLGEEHERAVECLEKAYELAKKVGNVSLMSWAGTNLADNFLGEGELNKALRLNEESVALDRKTGDQIHLTMSLGELGNIYRILGEWDKSEKYLQEAFNIAQGLKDYQAVGMGYGVLGWTYYEKGEYAKARELFEKGYEFMIKTGDKVMQWYWSYWVTDTSLELGEIEKTLSQISSLYDSALEREAKTGDKYPIAYAKRLKAKLLKAQGNWEESIEYFEKSLQDFEALNAKRWFVNEYAKRALFERAQVYLGRDQPGDREKADKLLNQALEIFQKLGAKRDIEATEAKLMRLEGRQLISEPKPVGYVTTGYSDLDRLLYGGIPLDCAVVLMSPSCNERDLLVKSFLETGAKKGEVAFYATINPGSAKTLADQYQSNFWLFVCNPQADAIVKDAPNVVKLKGVENLTDISIALTSAIRKLDPSLKGTRRICLDLVSDVLLQHHAVQTRRWLAGLIPELQSEGFTTLALIDPQVHPSEELHAILGLFDGEIDIFEKGAEQFLKIKRMSNQKYLKDELPLTKEQT